MARDFDGANDNIAFGSDASLDDFVSQSVAAWVRLDVQNASMAILNKQQSGGVDGWSVMRLDNAGGNRIRLRSFWTTNGTWTAGSVTSTTVPVHVAVVYSNNSVSNDPTIYLDGVAQSLVADTNPTGAYGGDAAGTLRTGETGDLGADLDGVLSHLVYANALWTAAQVNQARWYGKPFGNVEVYHPFVTDSLVNLGTAVADGTATGTTMGSLPRVERNYCCMLGVGR